MRQTGLKSDLRYAVSAKGTEHAASAKRTPHTPTSFPLDFALHLLCWRELQQRKTIILSQATGTDKEAPLFVPQITYRTAHFWTPFIIRIALFCT